MERPVLWTYIRADFSSCVPNSNNFHVTCDQGFSLPLLPVKHQPGVSIAWNELRQCPEGCNYFDILCGLIVAKELEHAIGGSGQQKRLVVLIDVSDFVDLRTNRVSIGKLIQALVALPVPDTVLRGSQWCLNTCKPIETYAMVSRSSATAM